MWHIILHSDSEVPPHTRGTLSAPAISRSSPRITPAYAGNTRTCIICNQRFEDHPRLRGEHLLDPQTGIPQQGPPRLRGEHLNINFATFFILGSPPLTRGTQCCLCWILQIARITPAYAGNTSYLCRHSRYPEDHPRLRGEHRLSDSMPLGKPGSPPHTRGTQFSKEDSILKFRITPAYAGNTRGQQRGYRRKKDHPRIRGEHYQPFLNKTYILGSPPHTRGTHKRSYRSNL